MRSLRRSAKRKPETIGRLTKDLIHRKRSPFPKGEGKKATHFAAAERKASRSVWTTVGHGLLTVPPIPHLLRQFRLSADRYKRLGREAEPYRGADCHTSDVGHWFAMTALGFPFGEAVAKRLMRSLRRSANSKPQTVGRLTEDLIRHGFAVPPSRCGSVTRRL